jgi:hypothetical protein
MRQRRRDDLVVGSSFFLSATAWLFVVRCLLCFYFYFLTASINQRLKTLVKLWEQTTPIFYNNIFIEK